MNPPCVLVVDSEAPIRVMLERLLVREGFRARVVPDGRSASRALARGKVDLVVMDLMLPDISGEELCRKIRHQPRTQGVSILMTTGRMEDGVAARCLDSGADDYLVKPFDLNDFLAHVRALLRRPKAYAAVDLPIQKGKLVIQAAERRVLWAGKPVADLTPKEYELLRQLVLSAPQVLDKSTLALRVWGVPYRQLHQRTLDVHVQRVRKKLGASAGVCLRTIPAVGYQWVVHA